MCIRSDINKFVDFLTISFNIHDASNYVWFDNTGIGYVAVHRMNMFLLCLYLT